MAGSFAANDRDDDEEEEGFYASMASSIGDKSNIQVRFNDPMSSAPNQMYRPEIDSPQAKFTSHAKSATMPGDQMYTPYDERAIGGSGKYDLQNIPHGYEIEDESEMFEEAEQN